MRALLCLFLTVTVLRGGLAQRPPPDGISFIGLTNFASFSRSARAGASVLVSPWFTSPQPWKELVVSWNAVCPPGTWLQIEARAAHNDATTPFYTLGHWTVDTNQHPRESVPGQKGALAEVKTDTLVVHRPMERVQIRLTLGGDSPGARLKFLGLCMDDPSTARPTLPPNRQAWGRVIDVPTRSQLGHPEASGWCSPTCVSMILAYWARVLGRPGLDLPVPVVAKGVDDHNWPGTGNWPFNTAFAGQFDGLRAYVTRFADVAEIEEWVTAGVPVAASVSFDLLNGKPADEGNGHLVVVTGFAENGDVVVNDPWPDPRKLNSVRKVFSRARLSRAWARSRHTVYLIYPEAHQIPRNRHSHWTD
jgi:hypothetical protein